MFKSAEIMAMATVNPINVLRGTVDILVYTFCNIALKKMVVIQATQQVQITNKV